MKLKFKRDSWHRNLQCYVLGLKKYSYYDMPNLCPYFWITIFCMLVVPFVFLFRSCRNGFNGTMNGISWAIEKVLFEPLDNYVFNPMYESRARRLDGIDVYRAYKRGDKVFSKWLNLHQGEADALIAKYKAEWQKWKKDQEARDQARGLARRSARERRKKLAIRIASVMQKTFPFLAAAILLGLGYVLFLLVRAIYRVWVWQAVLKVSGIILLIVLGICLAAIIFLVLQAFVQYLKNRDTCAPVIRREGPGPIKRFLCWFFGGLAENIVGFVEFFVQYIKASKENYCPAIEWED